MSNDSARWRDAGPRLVSPLPSILARLVALFRLARLARRRPVCGRARSPLCLLGCLLALPPILQATGGSAHPPTYDLRFATYDLRTTTYDQVRPNPVLLVVNEASADSVKVGDDYARKRNIPDGDIVRVKIPPMAPPAAKPPAQVAPSLTNGKPPAPQAATVPDEISRFDFERQILTPIVQWFARTRAHDRILYIVLTKGVPLRIAGTSGRDGTTASVDSELALLYRRMTGTPAPIVGSVPNPYFAGEAPSAEAKRFTHADADIYLVTRLDGFTVEDVVALVGRGAAPQRGGRVLLDQKAAWTDKGNEWLKVAADRLASAGFGDRVVLESTSRVLAGERDVLGYYSWGSNDPAITQRRFDLGFLPGAIAAMFVSSDARTFREPPAEWKIGRWTDNKTFFAGSPQSLAGDLVREGVTGVAGHVAEPYLDATVRPDILFPAYLAGFNLAESFYMAIPYLSWQTVVVGDPLCAPFERPASDPADADPGLDEATELPRLFSRRRLRSAAASAPGLEAATLMVKAESRIARDDRAGARESLEQATKLAPGFVGAHLALASLYEAAEEYDPAIERYRQVLTLEPSNVVALNNLAYGLAVRKGRPGDALPFAERAYALSPQSPALADTLGWIHHLLGDDERAGPLLAQAVKLSPASGEIRLHMAIVLASRGMMEGAAAELAKAVELQPELDKRDEVRALRERLKVK